MHRLIPALLVLLLVACRDDDNDITTIPGDAVYDFVTLAETGPVGSVFLMQRSADAPVVTLRSPYSFKGSAHIQPGDRLVICYTPSPTENSDGSRHITLYGYIAMASTALDVVTPLSDTPPHSSPFRMVSMWRTGCYINVHTDIFVMRPAHPDRFELSLVPSTADDPVVHLVMSYSMPEGADGVNPNAVYASFDISSVWNRPSCRGVCIHYLTRDGFDLSTFMKPEQENQENQDIL